MFLSNIKKRTNTMLLLSVFLRGLSPKSKEYLATSLIDHASALGDIDTRKDGYYELLLERLELTDLEDAPQEERDPRFREKINELFVDNRSIFIDNFSDGLTLGGSVDWAVCFQLLPPEAVSKIAFAFQLIREEDLVDEDGNLRFIEFTQEECEDAKIAMDCYKETQEQLKKAIALLFQEKARDNPVFLNQFVAHRAGQSYIPNIDLNPDFKIFIEFNHTQLNDDFLPQVHTCVHTILLPAAAYAANIETFQKKLSIVMHLLGDDFDMA
jgi:hypothetical protein